MDKRTCSIEGCEKTAEKLGWCVAHYKRWRRNGDPEGGRQTYRFDQTFFDVIDTEARAYWLGFITADGCVRTDHSNHQLKVKLKESDASHLEKLKAALAANHPIKSGERRGVAGPWVSLAVSSPHMVDSLASLGVTPRKSLTVQPWNGPSGLMRHYWRGLVDGDGCIGKASGRDKWSVTLCGSAACMEAFAEWAHGICQTSSSLYFRSNIWYWKVSGLAAPQALVRELYSGATVYLDRKYSLAMQLAATPVRPGPAVGCSVASCSGKHLALGYCHRHYQQIKKHGVIKIP